MERLRGIEPYEVSQVLTARRRRPVRAVGAAAMGGIGVLTIWGRTHAGRALMVATRRKDAWDNWIIGARELRAGELKEFEDWEAERDE
jgi:hypothetical protein